MKLFSILSLAAIVSQTPVFAIEKPCTICADGITEDNFALPGSDSNDPTTGCEYIVSLTAQAFTEGDENCEASKMNERYCCPDPNIQPCTICADGITAGEDFVLPGSDDGESPPTTCKMIVDQDLAFFSEGDENCEVMMKTYEAFCCPKEQQNPCLPCPNGITVSDDYKPSPGDDRTCKDYLDMFMTFDADSDMCKEVLEEVASEGNPCCPDDEVSTPPAESTDGDMSGDTLNSAAIIGGFVAIVSTLSMSMICM